MNSTHCAHHWMIETANGPLSRGSCSLCGEEREFSNSPEYWGGWTIQSKAWFDRSDWTGPDLGVKAEYAEVDGE